MFGGTIYFIKFVSSYLSVFSILGDSQKSILFYITPSVKTIRYVFIGSYAAVNSRRLQTILKTLGPILRWVYLLEQLCF